MRTVLFISLLLASEAVFARQGHGNHGDELLCSILYILFFGTLFIGMRVSEWRESRRTKQAKIDNNERERVNDINRAEWAAKVAAKAALKNK